MRDRRSVSDRRAAERRAQPTPPPLADPDKTDEVDGLDGISTNPRHRADESRTSPEMQVPTDHRARPAPGGDDTAPQSPIDQPAHPPLPGEDITSPERFPPVRVADTDELVSPRPQAPAGAVVRDRISRPPPLPDAVWTSAAAAGVPAGGDRRAVERVPCAVRVEVHAADERALLTSRDLSSAGVYVFAPRARPVGLDVQVVLHLGDDRVRLAGQVVHGQAGVGYAIRFVDVSPEARRRLGAFLADAARRARSA